MSPLMKCLTPVLAVTLLLSLSNAAVAQEAEKKQSGTVSGTVLDKDGKPASGVQVRLFHPFERGQRREAARARQQQADPAAGADAKEEKPRQGDKPRRAERPKPVATATTDADGKFTMSDVPVGKYVVLAMIRGQGSARQEVEVTAGGTANVELKLKKRAAKGGRKAARKGEAPAAE